MTDAVTPASQPEAVAAPQGEAAAAAAVQPRQEPQANVDNDQDRNWRALRSDRDYWRDRAAQLERVEPQPRQEQRQAPEQPEAPKTLADFEFDEVKYQTHLFEQAEKRAVAAAEQRLREQSEREKAERRKTTFNQREQEFAKDKPDYVQKTRDPRVPISPAVADVLAESDDGPALAYYLANNIDVAAQISQLPPLQAAREIGRIEAKLIAEREKAKAATSTVANQPAPAPKLEGGEGSGATVKPDTPESDELSDKEWTRRRNAQIRARANSRK